MLDLLLDRLHERGIDPYMVRVRFPGARFDGPPRLGQDAAPDASNEEEMPRTEKSTDVVYDP